MHALQLTKFGDPGDSVSLDQHLARIGLSWVAATLKSKLADEDTPLTAPERAMMEQWLTSLADAPTAAAATSGR